MFSGSVFVPPRSLLGFSVGSRAGVLAQSHADFFSAYLGQAFSGHLQNHRPRTPHIPR